MNAEIIQDYATWAALVVALVAALGEWLHARRVARVSALAFGPVGRARHWTRVVPALRVVALSGVVWSLITLISFSNFVRDREENTKAKRHLMVLLDVSPSMMLKDAGESGTEMRTTRASAVLKSVLGRIPGNDVSFTAAGFYTETRLLLENCKDRELILHLASGTPFHITYEPGKTDVLKCLNQAGELMKTWARKSTTLLVISDGDSVPPAGLKPMPSSVAQVIFAGVGDPRRGTPIDGHTSRQDTATLSQLSHRLGGRYFDCNLRHLPSDVLAKLNAKDPNAAPWRTDRRLLALITLAATTAVLCLLPLLLEYLGSAWRPQRTSAQSPTPRMTA